MNLDVYMHSWIVGDGNYRHFDESENRQFALEFWAPARLKKSEFAEKRITPTAPYTYQVNAELVFASNDISVIDFGLLAYTDSESDVEVGCRTGDFVQGNIALDVDPFFYFERLWKVDGVPALIYEWHIKSIEQDTTPLVLGEACGGRAYVRDNARTSFRPVKTTSEVWPNPHEIAPSYVLHCKNIDSPARKQFSRSQL